MPVLAVHVPPLAWADTNPRGALAIGLQPLWVVSCTSERVQGKAGSLSKNGLKQSRVSQQLNLGPWTSRCAPFVCLQGRGRDAALSRAGDWGASVCCCRTEHASVLERRPESSQSPREDGHPWGWRWRFREGTVPITQRKLDRDLPRAEISTQAAITRQDLLPPSPSFPFHPTRLVTEIFCDTPKNQCRPRRDNNLSHTRHLYFPASS
jgi:hypothetical protein